MVGRALGGGRGTGIQEVKRRILVGKEVREGMKWRRKGEEGGNICCKNVRIV